MAGHVPPDGRGGGIVRYTVELARALGRREDVELHLLTSPAAAGPLAELAGGSHRIVPLPAVPDALVPALERFALGRRLGSRFDVVHGTKHLLPRGVAARTVLTVHDLLLFDRPEDFPLPKRTLLGRPYAGSLRQADTLLCVSAATRDRLVRWDSALAERTVVAPLTTSPQLLGSEPVPVPALAGRPFALVVGDASARKNVAVAVSALARVVRHRPDAVLALVGPPAWGVEAYGPDHAALLASGNVVQLTGVDDGTLRWCYENCAVVLAPSLVEGFGLPAVEALDLGAPLVTSLDPALVEVSGDRAEHLPADDVTAWAGAALRHLDHPAADRPDPTRHRRTWDDVAAETVAAVVHRPAAGPVQRG
ncbi:glycosyltransferase family 4 protein [Modestobacter muralis]|uniref:Glycosyltransferase family 4 protein n=2 Tax=Modestobacter muralis TaxID=1608614 RepID=A0A6P0EU35_9ACTN|nr:glycosyltransferase family 1 protein [Modestobacter muralis]NEK94485.1 glycosyltransferase family 4 protein [Modestobacter muralis]NEN51373.1 glycosyltransferase family 4 protein [Modestobacter muralis]